MAIDKQSCCSALQLQHDYPPDFLYNLKSSVFPLLKDYGVITSYGDDGHVHVLFDLYGKTMDAAALVAVCRLYDLQALKFITRPMLERFQEVQEELKAYWLSTDTGVKP